MLPHITSKKKMRKKKSNATASEVSVAHTHTHIDNHAVFARKQMVAEMPQSTAMSHSSRAERLID